MPAPQRPFSAALSSPFAVRKKIFHLGPYEKQAFWALKQIKITRKGSRDAVADLASDVSDCAGAVWEEDRLRLRGGSDVAQRLEVLGDEQQLRDLLAAAQRAEIKYIGLYSFTMNRLKNKV